MRMERNQPILTYMNSLDTINRMMRVACALLLATSCANEEIPSPTDGPAITFLSDGVTSRADETPFPEAGYELFPDGAVMGIFAYTLSDGVFDENNSTPDLLYNASLTKLTTGGYLYNPMAHWPVGGKVRFAAYHPHSGSLAPGAITLTPSTVSGLPEITLDLNKVTDKVDFSVAVLEPIAPLISNDPPGTPARNDYQVNFRFKRKISELFFRAKVVDMPPLINLYINMISVKNIYTKGIYNMKKEQWSYPEDIDGLTGATIALGASGTRVDKNDFIDIISPGNEGLTNRANSVVMLPQTYDHMELDIIYTLEYMKSEGGCEYRIVGKKKMPLSIAWEPGKMYSYDLEFNFNGIVGEQIPFRVSVKDWEKKEIDTTID